MNNFGSYMLTHNPNRPGNANNVMIVAMSRSLEGHQVLTATWDGSENPKPVFFGSDEMMTLTPEESAARDTMIGALTLTDEEDARIQRLIKESREEGFAEGRAEAIAAAKVKASSLMRIWFVVAALGWGSAALLYTTTLLA